MNLDVDAILSHLGDEAPPYRRCGLTVEDLGTAATIEDAWRFLPAQGEGVVVLADRIVHFSPGSCPGLLIEADVVNGDTTTLIRQTGNTWRAWRWTESATESHLGIDVEYLSSVPAPAGRVPHVKYRTYWTLRDDDGISVWQPCGARFAGFVQN